MGKILELLIDNEDYVWLMIDASHIKVHPHGVGAKGGNQDMERTKGGSAKSIENYKDRRGIRSRKTQT